MKRTRVQINTQAFDIFTSTYLVMYQFFKYPSLDFTLTEIAQNTGLSKGTVSKIIKELRTIGFVNVLDLEVVYRIRANLESNIFRREKIASNYYTMIRSNIPEFLIQRYNNPRCIVLFGSYRKGEDNDGSDIDIAVEVSDGITGAFKFPDLAEFEKLVKRKITVHVFNRQDIDANLFVNIANGIVLYGFLEVSK
jgi:predicted nucleotidyltransferase